MVRFNNEATADLTRCVLPTGIVTRRGLAPNSRQVGLANRKETVLPPHSGQSLSVEGFVMASKFMASKFAIGDKVDQAFSNHAEGTVVAIFDNLAGEQRYAIEMFGHRTIQIAAEGSLVVHGHCAR